MTESMLFQLWSSHRQYITEASDVNKDWTLNNKDKEKDKDSA